MKIIMECDDDRIMVGDTLVDSESDIDEVFRLVYCLLILTGYTPKDIATGMKDVGNMVVAK